jgi:hypothetical protein
MMVYIYQRQNLTVPSVFQATARRHPNRVCLYFEEEAWTFKQVCPEKWLFSLVFRIRIGLIVNPDPAVYADVDPDRNPDSAFVITRTVKFLHFFLLLI